MQCSELIAQEATQAVIVCVASSFNWAYILTPLVICVSVGVAFLGVRSARASARQRATLDMIEKVESAPHYRELHKVFSYHRRQNSFSRLHDPKEEKDKTERQAVVDYLNHYELISIGINNEILDAGFYQSWMLGPFVRDWNAAADFIQRERWKWDGEAGEWRYHSPQYENYQAVATSWSADAKKLDKTTSQPPQKPSGPGDESMPD